MKGRSKTSDKVAFRELVERLAREVNARQQKHFNDLLIGLALEHGWSVYWAVVNRLVEMQSRQFKEQYKDRVDGSAYRVLGVSEDADDEVVRFAYLTLAKKCHPDRGGDAEAMGRINFAFQSIAIQRGWRAPMLPAAKEE